MIAGRRLAALLLALLVLPMAQVWAHDDDDRGRNRKNMRLVGYNDLQARSAYQNVVGKALFCCACFAVLA